MTDPVNNAEGRAETGQTRRDCLKTAAIAGAAFAVPTIVPARVLGRDGAVAPSEKIVMAGIGLGPRGQYVLDWMGPEKDIRFVAIADVQKSRRDEVKAKIDKLNGDQDCKTYADFEEMLATRPDIDGVLLATGDRWHAQAAIRAMRLGKDVYSEKPSSMTVAEGRAVVDAAARYGRVYQTGTQRLSEGPFRQIIELARKGKLGKIHTVRAHIAPWDSADLSHAWLPEEPLPPADELNWDAWLGGCPWRPYNSGYTKGGWRGHYDFHTSCIGEWGAHTFAQGQAGIDALDTSPVEYGYVNNVSGDGMVTTFANGVKMVLQREGWRGSCGMTFEGDEGSASCADGYEKPDVSSPALAAEGEKLLAQYMEETGRPMNHVRDFFDCVKSRRQPVANPEVMHRSMSTVHAANVCMWLRRDVQFDPVREEFVGDAEANRFLTRAQRAPWII
ncbi:Gfo/Idh/MocA family oxidoreductase [Paludisphaera sp.]|uniref:Gfo/Idh/MocA family protein n=1 Tax=Paludisphaera sp. TaxID=2017432 RepID=UPI00301C75BB